jgi:hypothetical protein
VEDRSGRREQQQENCQASSGGSQGSVKVGSGAESARTPGRPWLHPGSPALSFISLEISLTAQGSPSTSTEISRTAPTGSLTQLAGPFTALPVTVTSAEISHTGFAVAVTAFEISLTSLAEPVSELPAEVSGSPTDVSQCAAEVSGSAPDVSQFAAEVDALEIRVTAISAEVRAPETEVEEFASPVAAQEAATLTGPCGGSPFLFVFFTVVLLLKESSGSLGLIQPVERPPARGHVDPVATAGERGAVSQPRGKS